MIRNRLIFLLIVVPLVSCAADPSASDSARNTRVAPEPEPSWNPQPAYDLEDAGRHIHAYLSLTSPPSVTIGESIDFAIRFNVMDNDERLYNPFFNRLISPPAALAVFDAQGHYVGDLLSQGSDPFTGRRTPMEQDWVAMPRDSYVGALITTDAKVPSPPTYDRKIIKPGKYTVQMILYRAFTSEPMLNGHPPKNFDNRELFRSNAVEIEITPWRS